MDKYKQIPKITVGRYAGTPIDQLPNSYLRWMITQDFNKEWVEIAIRKLKESDYNDSYVSVSRYAVDVFSQRFIHKWFEAMDFNPASCGRKALDVDGMKEHGILSKTPGRKVGLGTFIATMAQEAWEKGKDISKHRHSKDGVIRSYKGIYWVFGVNPDFPDYKDVITIMFDDVFIPRKLPHTSRNT